MLTISQERRREIVRRDGGTTLIVAAATKDQEGLAFAVRFLMDHYLYKMSKSAGVNGDGIRATAEAARVGIQSYIVDIARPMGVDLLTEDEPVEARPVSGLGEGTVKNPYDYI